MDYTEPKTRTEKKGKKEKGVYSAKHVRQVEALAEKRVGKKPHQKTFLA